MAKVFLGIGSNIRPKWYIQQALMALREKFQPLEQSPIYESEAIGFDGDNFLNLVVAIDTALSVGELQSYLKELEENNGRERNSIKFSGRTLDIDILLYDNTVGVVDGVHLPRYEILMNAFVLRPLCDIAPKLMHPSNGKTIDQLWHEYDKNQQKLWQVALSE